LQLFDDQLRTGSFVILHSGNDRARAKSRNTFLEVEAIALEMGAVRCMMTARPRIHLGKCVTHWKDVRKRLLLKYWLVADLDQV
jgi:hypothetical protein